MRESEWKPSWQPQETSVTDGKAEKLIFINSSSEGLLNYPKNYTRNGNEYTFGKKYNCLGFQYAPLRCYYNASDKVDIIYDIRTWLHFKGKLSEVIEAGYVWFADFHIQANKQFDHPYHLLNLFRKFHEDDELYKELMWFT